MEAISQFDNCPLDAGSWRRGVVRLGRLRQLLSWNTSLLCRARFPKLPSTDRTFPCTGPTSTHCFTIYSNNCSNGFDS